MRRIQLEGGEGARTGAAERVLTVSFDSLIEELTALADPDERKLEQKAPGADLLAALAGQTDSFGAASPGVPDAAPLAERILALTDEAFDAAVEILNAADLYDDRRTLEDPELKTLFLRLDGALFNSIAGHVSSLEAAADRRVAQEFV